MGRAIGLVFTVLAVAAGCEKPTGYDQFGDPTQPGLQREAQVGVLRTVTGRVVDDDLHGLSLDVPGRGAPLDLIKTQATVIEGERSRHAALPAGTEVRATFSTDGQERHLRRVEVLSPDPKPGNSAPGPEDDGLPTE